MTEARVPSQQGRDTSTRRYSNLIYDSELFLTKLGEFKSQSLGCQEARRKSSSALTFPSPPQACVGPHTCNRFPHDVKPTPGYWIECHGPGKDVQTRTMSTGYEYAKTSTAQSSEHVQISIHRRASDETPKRPILDRTNSSQIQYGDPQARSSPVRGHEDRKFVLEGQRKSSISSHNMPTTPTAERIITRHNKDIKSDQDELDEFMRAELIKQRDFESTSALRTNVTITGQESRIACEKRRRLSKRTITRDDIDLHKPRRGTPDITITEPSFNQSTCQPSTKSIKPIRQDSVSNGSQHYSADYTAPDEPSSIRSQPNRTSSIESPSSSGPDGQRGSSSQFILRQPFTEVEEAYSFSGGEMSEYVAHHRPSIIREDDDLEQATEAIQNDKNDVYCGLSTSTFNKKSYREICQQPMDSVLFKDSSLELICFEEENYEKHYYGREHWNYFTNDELLGPVMLSLKQEVNNRRDHFHVLLRTVSYTLHGTIPASTICADRYDREAIVRELSEIAKLKPPLMLGQLPSTPDDLLKLDHIFIKTELKVGVIYIREGQQESEEAILGNHEESPLFNEFLDILGDRITLKGFDRYKGGLDTVHNLTGTESVYTTWRNIEIMFHVSTMLPHEECDAQKLQKKRHIGNDIVCVAFIESDDDLFWPGCIKSFFLHTFITVRTSPKPVREGEKRKYIVGCVCRNEVQHAFKPHLVENDEFFKSDYFREWLLVKIVNGERASYSAPKFARMQDRTRSQLLEDIIANLANHLYTGQIPKPYRRGSWRPLGHTRATSPLQDSTKDNFVDYDLLAKDFYDAFCGPCKSMLCDVAFRVRDKDGIHKMAYGVRAILAIRSNIFAEMLYGFVPNPDGNTASIHDRANLQAIEMKALSGESSGSSHQATSKDNDQSKTLLGKRGSFGADQGKKMAERERRQSMIPSISRQKPNYLTVPSTGEASGGSTTSGMIKNAFSRLVSGNWSGWGANIKGYKGDQMSIKVDPNKTKIDINSLALCKEIDKIDPDKLAIKEFEVKEFDFETFQQIIEYIHNGQCTLSYDTIPTLICAAEHYGLPELVNACIHHIQNHLKLSMAPKMMNALYEKSCFYVSALELLEMLQTYIDGHGDEFLSKTDYLELYESVLTGLLARKTLQASELKKFLAMHDWTRKQISDKQEQKKRHEPIQEECPMDAPAFDLEAFETEYRNLMRRLNKDINIKLDKISSEDLVKIILPTKVFSNEKIFDVMSDETRIE